LGRSAHEGPEFKSATPAKCLVHLADTGVNEPTNAKITVLVQGMRFLRFPTQARVCWCFAVSESGQQEIQMVEGLRKLLKKRNFSCRAMRTFLKEIMVVCGRLNFNSEQEKTRLHDTMIFGKLNVRLQLHKHLNARELAPRARFELATLRLTALCLI